jgi:hypothetical protein
MSTDDRHVDLTWITALELTHKRTGSNDIKSRNLTIKIIDTYTKQSLWVIHTSVFHDLGNNRNSAVYRITNNADKCFWARGRDCSRKVLDDTSVYLEKIVTGHAWLTWDAGWDDDNVRAGKGIL